MKISSTFKHLLAASAVAATVNSSALHANGEPAAVELLSGTSSLGAAVLSPRSLDGNVLIYDGSSDATPVVVYPINVSATITAETNPTVRTLRGGVTNYSTTFSTYRVTNTTLLGLIDGATPSSRLVYVEAYNPDFEMWMAYNIDGNNGLFVCSSSNLATGDLTAVDPDEVTVNLAGSFPLSRTNYSFLTSNNSTVSDQTVGNIEVFFAADGYSASGVGSFISTFSKGLKFSANLTNQEAYRLSRTSATFSRLNNFTVSPADFDNTETYTYNATNVTFNAGNFFESTFSQNITSVVYSLASNGGLTGATINSTTGVITFNATTAGTYNPVVTAAVFFIGRPTPTTVSTSDEGFATIALTVNPEVPVVTVANNGILSLTANQSSSSTFFTATPQPTSWAISPSPANGFVTFNTTTGIFTGNNTGNATYSQSFTVTATNAVGTSLPLYFNFSATPLTK